MMSGPDSNPTRFARAKTSRNFTILFARRHQGLSWGLIVLDSYPRDQPMEGWNIVDLIEFPL
jgi:hypothetical protein